MTKKKGDGYVRKEVKIHESVIELLKVGAARKGWSLKKFMENSLAREAKRQAPYSQNKK